MRSKVPSLAARAELQKLGKDLSIARRRRGMTQQRLAAGAGLNVSTLRRLEQGHPSVSLGSLAMALLVLGERGRLAQLLDAGRDDLGIALSIETLPKRVRTPAGKTGRRKDQIAADDRVGGGSGYHNKRNDQMDTTVADDRAF